MNQDITFCTTTTCHVRANCQRWQENHTLKGMWISMADLSDGDTMEDGCSYYWKKYEEVSRD